MEGRSLTVLFGSQTGTAHDVADRAVREAKRRHFSACAVSMDDYPVRHLIEESLVVFVCSTTGQGEPPDNMKAFWKFMLRKDLPSTSLSHLQFAVLGLGDSSYQKFNVVGKRLHKRMEQLGGTSIHKLGLADDQHDLGVDAVVTSWLQELWEAILILHPLPAGVEVISDKICPPSKFSVKLVDSQIPNDQKMENSNSTEALESTEPSIPNSLCPFHARLLSNKRVTSFDHFQDVRLIKLDISGSNIRYNPGDVVMVQPQNFKDSVKEFIELLHLDPNQQFHLEQNDPDSIIPPSIPSLCTVKWLVSNYLDINSVPRRSFFELLKYHAHDELEKEKLEEFCSAEGQEELYSYCNRVKRTILEVLQDFRQTSPTIPFQYLFDLIPPLQPRAFSIASSNKAHENELHILMAVVNYRTKLVNPRRGVCSTWLANLNLEQDQVHVPIWVKPGTIRFPKDNQIPLVMVGPGTGLAPFRSLIHERCCQSIGGLVLFFGCRSKHKDFFCQEDWKEPCALGLLKTFTAFSRDQEEKVYVQHLLREEGSTVWKMLNQENASFFIAGNAKSMPDDVKEALRDIISTHGEMTPQEALHYIQILERSRRFQVEAWS